VRLVCRKLNNKGRRRSFIGLEVGKYPQFHCRGSIGWGVGGFGMQFGLWLCHKLVFFFNFKSYELEIISLNRSVII